MGDITRGAFQATGPSIQIFWGVYCFQNWKSSCTDFNSPLLSKKSQTILQEPLICRNRSHDSVRSPYEKVRYSKKGQTISLWPLSVYIKKNRTTSMGPKNSQSIQEKVRRIYRALLACKKVLHIFALCFFIIFFLSFVTIIWVIVISPPHRICRFSGRVETLL